MKKVFLSFYLVRLNRQPITDSGQRFKSNSLLIFCLANLSRRNARLLCGLSHPLPVLDLAFQQNQFGKFGRVVL